MQNAHMIEGNAAMMNPGGFMRSFAASGVSDKEKKARNEQAKIIADVRGRYPYPPKNCEDATATVISIQDAIKSINDQAASGVLKKTELDNLLSAHNQVLQDFKTYVNAVQCINKALQVEDESFSTKLQSALDAENKTTTDSNKTNNILIFGTLGVLLIGAVVLIARK